MITLVAAVAKNGVIGKNGALPWHLPEDLKHFKEITMGKKVLMGRVTFDSILARIGKPLPNRTNIVVSSDTNYQVPEGVELYNSLDKVLDKYADEEICVAGGASIYDQTINKADRLYITKIHQNYKGDVYFPPIDKQTWLELTCENHEGYSFVTYERRKSLI